MPNIPILGVSHTDLLNDAAYLYLHNPSDQYYFGFNQFFAHGFTKLDTAVNFLVFLGCACIVGASALTLIILGSTMLPGMYMLWCKDSILTLIPKIIAQAYVGVCLSGLVAILAAAIISALLFSFAALVVLRTASSILGAISLPFYYMFKHLKSSETPVQDVAVGLGVGALVTSVPFWVVVAATAVSPTILGVSAIAAFFLAAALPVAVGLTALGVASLAGYGIYQKITASSHNEECGGFAPSR